jgi:hypothetical protein
MSTPFDSLSTQGRIAKIEMHVETGHPVPADWVRWLLVEVDGEDAVADPSSPQIAKPFATLDRGGRMQKINAALDEGTVPGPWVSWLLDESVHASEPTAPAP